VKNVQGPGRTGTGGVAVPGLHGMPWLMVRANPDVVLVKKAAAVEASSERREIPAGAPGSIFRASSLTFLQMAASSRPAAVATGSSRRRAGFHVVPLNFMFSTIARVAARGRYACAILPPFVHCLRKSRDCDHSSAALQGGLAARSFAAQDAPVGRQRSPSAGGTP
jgi:hypothetical protein